MEIYDLIRYVSLVVWLFPPFRQYMGKYFYYFLILALTDPIANLMLLINLNPLIIYTPSSVLMLISLLDYKIKEYRTIFIIIVSTLLSYIITLSPIDYFMYSQLIIHFIITLIVVKIFSISVFEKKELNVFIVMLFFYQALMVTRTIALLVEYYSGLAFLYIIGTLQIFLAIFFTIFRENSKIVKIKLVR